MPVEPRLIELAYQLFLDRKPESAEVVSRKAAALNSTKEVRENFMGSREFLNRNYQDFIGNYLLNLVTADFRNHPHSHGDGEHSHAHPHPHGHYRPRS